MCRSALSFVFVIAVSVAVIADEPNAKKAKVDPSGTWKWERTFGDNHLDYTLRLKLDKDGTLTGTNATRWNDRVGEPSKIEDAKFDGNKLTFSVTRSRNDREFTMVYEGTVSEKGIAG